MFRSPFRLTGAFALSSSQLVTGCRWGTANTIPQRDPIEWSLAASKKSPSGPFKILDQKKNSNDHPWKTWLDEMKI